MKQGIHPDYKQVRVTCSCGNEFVTGSSLGVDHYNIELCNKCHPFYTGKMKVIDNAGRVSDFYKRFGNKTTMTGK